MTSGPAKVAILRVEGNNGVVVVVGVGGTRSNIRIYSGQTAPSAIEVSWLLNTPPPSHIIKSIGNEGGRERGEKIAEAGRNEKGLGYNVEVNRRLAPE